MGDKRRPSDLAIQIAARCWCDDRTSAEVMNTKICWAVAERIDLLLKHCEIADLLIQEAREDMCGRLPWRQSSDAWRENQARLMSLDNPLI